MVTVLIAARLQPDLVDTRVQLVFADEYGMDGNHFTALWDRIGAWAPRRLVLDPWQKGECRECHDYPPSIVKLTWTLMTVSPNCNP